MIELEVHLCVSNFFSYTSLSIVLTKYAPSKYIAHLLCSNNEGGPKVYDVTTYLDDHPGGAEVMLDVAGKDADEFFEDIGHSNDARDELAKHVIGVLKLTEEEKEKRRLAAEKKSSGDGGGMSMIAILVAAIGIGYYFYKQKVESSE
jgi:cytochrome b involved in lipid metabolism